MDKSKIPLALRQKAQWVPFQIGPETNGDGKLKKTPLIAGTTQKASPTDPTTWTTFEEACKWGHPAYCLTKEDGLVFIDMDEKLSEAIADQLMDAFDGTYMELSASQTGVHVLTYATMLSDKGHNSRKHGIEMYSHSRFCIFTGILVNEQGTISHDHQDVVRKLEEDLMSHKGVHAVDLSEEPETEEDQLVLEKCRSRHDKFQDLWEGRWNEDNYPSHSEADHALIGMLVGATKSNEQVKRLWLRSGLYRADKPHKFKYSLQVCRGKQQQEQENDEWFAGFARQLKAQREEYVKTAPPVDKYERNDPRLFTTIPEGLLREFYEAFQRYPRYPLKEASLLAAIITALALFQRKYQSHTHLALNMWLFLVGESSAGKEMIRKGPSALFRDANAPMENVFGGEIRSSPGVEDALRGSLRHLAYHKECHTWLRALCDPHSGPNWMQTRSKIMDSYTAGSDTWLLRQTKTQRGERKEYEINRPCLTIFGDCVTERFYEAVGTAQISDGFLPRCLVLETDQESISEDPNNRQEFTPALLDRINRLATDAMMADVSGAPVIVPITPDAERFYNALAREIRVKLKASKNDPHNALRGKVEEKVNKLATLCGICRDPNNPRVTLPDMEWAQLFVRVCDGRMAACLNSGEHDPAMHQQRKTIQSKLDMARLMGTKERGKLQYFSTDKLITEPDLIPWGWLRDQAGRLACFKNDRRGIHVALTSVVKDLESSGELIIVGPEQAREKYGVRSVILVNCRETYADSNLF